MSEIYEVKEGQCGLCSDQRGKWLATVFIHVYLGGNRVRPSTPLKRVHCQGVKYFTMNGSVPIIP